MSDEVAIFEAHSSYRVSQKNAIWWTNKMETALRL